MSVEVMCHEHPDRVAGVRCQRCERPICPGCMRQAAVGFQCPSCAAGGARNIVSSRAAMGRSRSDIVAGKVIVAINVVVFVLMVGTSRNPTGASGPIAEHGVLFGPAVALGDWWRIVTGAFLHAGILHLGMNMLLLWFLSQELEPALGRARFVLLYVVSLLGGSLGVLVLSPLTATVGASGAVFGLMGALIVFQIRAKQNPWQSGLGGLIVINLVLTFVIPGISIGGHLGGLLAGAACGAILQPLAWPQRDAALRTAAVAGFGVALAAASIHFAPDLVRAALF